MPVPVSLPTSRYRLPGLVLAIALIVIGPFLLTAIASRASLRAQEALVHAHEVEAAIAVLSADVRNTESAALGQAFGVEARMLHERINYSRPRIEPQLDRLEALTRDSPAQQRMLGELRSLLELRMGEVYQILDTGRVPSVEDMERMLTRYPIHDLVDAINDEEMRLLDLRRSEARAAEGRARLVSGAGLALQLALLALLSWYGMREGARRISAERDSRLANQRATVMLDTVREPIALLDADTRVLMYNAAFAELYGVGDDRRGEPLTAFGDGAWDDATVLRRLTDVLARDRELWDFQVTQRTADNNWHPGCRKRRYAREFCGDTQQHHNDNDTECRKNPSRTWANMHAERRTGVVCKRKSHNIPDDFMRNMTRREMLHRQRLGKQVDGEYTKHRQPEATGCRCNRPL